MRTKYQYVLTVERTNPKAEGTPTEQEVIFTLLLDGKPDLNALVSMLDKKTPAKKKAKVTS